MTRTEHYFENLLHYGKDIDGEPNKKGLLKCEQEAVEQCVQYVLYSLCNDREDFKRRFLYKENT